MITAPWRVALCDCCVPPILDEDKVFVGKFDTGMTARDLKALLSLVEGVADDSARVDALFALLPFEVRHKYGGDEQEFRQGVDAARLKLGGGK